MFGQMMGSMAGVAVADRVVITKHRATVRYVGPVHGHDGVWVGVEWDDPSRGKHDGATCGRRYFSCCSSAPTAASFVRANKVSPGTTLVDALVLRYTNQLAEGQNSTADGQHAYVSTASNRKLWVELVGQDQVTARQSKLELLTSARLVGANVSSVVSCSTGCTLVQVMLAR
jgi:dynactin complex subunit